MRVYRRNDVPYRPMQDLRVRFPRNKAVVRVYEETMVGPNAPEGVSIRDIMNKTGLAQTTVYNAVRKLKRARYIKEEIVNKTGTAT